MIRPIGCAEGLGCAHDTCDTCGGLGQPCCQDGACHTGKCTFGNICAADCGGEGQRCCLPSGSCNGALTCDGETCRVCGTPGAPCCAANVCNDGGCCDWSLKKFPWSRCIPNGGACGTTHGTCTMGGCTTGTSACGKLGEPCCGENISCTQPFTECAGTCVGCGHAGENCCELQTCGAGLTCKDFSCQ